MPFSRVVDLAAHENGTGSVAEGARFVMRVRVRMRMRVIFVVSGRRHCWFYFCFWFCFTVYFIFGVFDEMLVGWIGILMMMMMMILV